MVRAISIAVFVAAIAAGTGWVLTAPQRIDAALVGGSETDLSNGEQVFYAGGCSSCHAADGSKGDAKLTLSGGHRLETPFGTFVAPNISPDPDHGIGAWSELDFFTAMKLGTSPAGEHYYPAFPYSSYARMTDQDLHDLFAYLQTLPASAEPNQPHELGFPFSIRRGIGVWKALYLDATFVTPEPGDPAIKRGRYLVEATAHCGECHTPRDWMGGSDHARWLMGAPNPAGKGSIPNITNSGEFAEWSESDIAEYLSSGFTPEYDSVGGSMTAVVENTAKLPDSDRAAIAAYLKTITSIKAPQ